MDHVEISNYFGAQAQQLRQVEFRVVAEEAVVERAACRAVDVRAELLMNLFTEAADRREGVVVLLHGVGESKVQAFDHLVQYQVGDGGLGTQQALYTMCLCIVMDLRLKVLGEGKATYLGVFGNALVTKDTGCLYGRLLLLFVV